MNTISAACGELLVQAQGFDPLYGPRLANHLPMALVALDRLGADGATLQAFAAHYSKRLAKLDEEPGITDPRACLGEGSHFPQVVRYFRQRIAAEGPHRVLREWIPVLMPGLAASAFHALIRLAYAIESGFDAELAQALAFWVFEFRALPLSMKLADGSPCDIAAGLADAVAGHVFSPGIIIDKMLEIAQHPALAGAAIQPGKLALREVAEFSIGAFVEHRDFTLLHTVTACHAMRLVLPFAGDTVMAVRYLWQAVLLAFLTAGRPDASGASSIPRLVEDDIRERARASLDDHVIKLCYSALCEYAAGKDVRYLQVASRELAR